MIDFDRGPCEEGAGASLGGQGIVFWGTFFLFAAGLLFCCCDNEKDGTSINRHVVRRGDLTITVSAPGKLRPAKQVTVKSRAAGEVSELLIEEGSTVEAGDVILRLDPEVERSRLARAEAEHRAAKAAAAQAEIRLEQEKNNYRRARELYREGMISRADHEAALYSYQLAQEDLTITTSRKEATSHALAEAEKRLSYTEIRAPMDGQAISLNVAPGQVVSSGATGLDTGSPLVTIADVSRLYLFAEVEETDVSRVKVGQEAAVRVDSYPGEDFKGVVEQVAPVAVQSGPITVVEVRIKLEETKGAELRPGMSASVEIITDRIKNKIILPVSAVVERDRPGVVLIKEGSTDWTPIELGPGDWQRVEVKNGLSAGQAVALPEGAP